MPSTIGTTLRVSVFGQSHSPAIGCVVEGLPSGVKIDEAALAEFMARRAPGNAPWSTPRKEADEVRIVSGLNPAGITCGTPLCAVIENTNTRSKDYDDIRRNPRPGHADFTAWVKWRDAHDIAGGGHFSGRLTAPLCAAGGIAIQLLQMAGVRVGAHVLQIAGARDASFCADSPDPDSQRELMRQMYAAASAPGIQTIDPAASSAMEAAIMAARAEGDSLGGIVECVACGLPAGVGSPMFDGLENTIARAAFGIPAVKGIEFGAGFGVAAMRGSEDNDAYTCEDGLVMPSSNNAGGALGGISTGAPIVFRLAIKPTPSISREQASVDLSTGKASKLAVKGRHDPCITPRAVPVAQAICALGVLDSWLTWPAPHATWRDLVRETQSSGIGPLAWRPFSFTKRASRT